MSCQQCSMSNPAGRTASNKLGKNPSPLSQGQTAHVTLPPWTEETKWRRWCRVLSPQLSLFIFVEVKNDTELLIVWRVKWFESLYLNTNNCKLNTEFPARQQMVRDDWIFSKIGFNKNFPGHFNPDEVVEKRSPMQTGFFVYFHFISVLIVL